MFDFTAARKNMVDCQIEPAGVTAPAILAAFEQTPREVFVSKAMQSVAYHDEDIFIEKRGGRFLMEPIVHAKILQALAPRSDDVALDIGGATGYSSAILSPLVSTVIMLEEHADYLSLAAKNWAAMEAGNIAAFQAVLTKGAQDHVPYDLIFMNGAVSEIPENIVNQLSPRGRMVAIVKKPGAVLGEVMLIEKTNAEFYSQTPLFSAGTPYLPGFAPVPAFVF